MQESRGTDELHRVSDEDDAVAAAQVSQKLLSRSVADWLAAEIIRGRFVPGERLHEVRLAELFDVSRSPVREALRILAREGLVDLVPRLGAMVAAIDATDAADLYACRILLEPECARRAVACLDRSDIAALSSARKAMEAAVKDEDVVRFLQSNVDYNKYLISRCDNRILREMVEVAWNKSHRYRGVLMRQENYIQLSLRRHRVLHRAVVAGDADAVADAEREILSNALDEIVASFDQLYAQERG
jgi:DNA-binding GntR family transcriptional regulator